ncbi:MAG: lipoprotein-releasing system ATP-binding protein [Cyclobacteriaceae bacterium]|jgi:lipoprotein-releasing system ATP-binding protein
MLVAKNIRKSYGALHVLSGIDIEIREKEIVSIVGASGAGKSTLLHVLGTLDNPDEGTVHIKEEEVFSFSARKLAKFRNREIGFVFQFHNLLPEFTALENVCIPGYMSSSSDVTIKLRGTHLLEKLGLSDRLTHKPSELSGGEQQRVSVARALINNPSLVFADEPSGNLDSKRARELHELFFQLRDEFGQTFVIVTHNMELANMADRKLEIVDGRVA